MLRASFLSVFSYVAHNADSVKQSMLLFQEQSHNTSRNRQKDERDRDCEKQLNATYYKATK